MNLAQPRWWDKPIEEVKKTLEDKGYEIAEIKNHRANGFVYLTCVVELNYDYEDKQEYTYLFSIQKIGEEHKIRSYEQTDII